MRNFSKLQIMTWSSRCEQLELQQCTPEFCTTTVYIFEFIIISLTKDVYTYIF